MEESQQLIEALINRYQKVKHIIQQEDPDFYEQWKAGGFLIDSDIVSMYPCLEDYLEEEE